MQKLLTYVAKTSMLAVAVMATMTLTAAAKEVGTVEADALRLRSGASLESSVLTLIPDGAQLTLDGLEGDWYKTSYNGVTGYVSKDYVVNVTTIEEEAPAAESVEEVTVDMLQQEVKQSIVDKACAYIGTRYVYGGCSPSGFDCSGFTMYIYSLFGYTLPHSATSQMSYGTSVEESQLHMGDLVFFRDSSYASSGASHVGIYIGNGKFVHAVNSRTPVSIDSIVDGGYWDDTYVGARRLVSVQ